MLAAGGGPVSKYKTPTAPLCAHCNAPALLTTGVTIYPSWQELADKFFWKCENCDAHVGCHGTTMESLGRPANKELRNARIKLHNLKVDPLWKTAVESCGYKPEDARARKIITNAARGRVYRYLGVKMQLDVEHCHIAMFTLDQCRQAWHALGLITYPEIRAWAKALKAQEAA